MYKIALCKGNINESPEVKVFFDAILSATQLESLINDSDLPQESSDIYEFLQQQGVIIDPNIVTLSQAQTTEPKETVRELIQNSRDATLIIRESSRSSQQEQTSEDSQSDIDIDIGICRGRTAIRTSDRAMGMLPETIFQKLLKPLAQDEAKLASSVAEGEKGWGFWSVIARSEAVDVCTVAWDSVQQKNLRTTFRIVVERNQKGEITSIQIKGFKTEETVENTGTQIQAYLYSADPTQRILQNLEMLIESRIYSSTIVSSKRYGL